MKSFFKTFLASLLAMIAGSGCLVIFFFIGLTALIGSLATLVSSKQPAFIERHTVLKIDVAELADVVVTNPLNRLSSAEVKEPVALSSALEAISSAKNNPNISAIYLNVEDIAAGMASVDALRRALVDFKASGKPVLAYADNYSQKAYYLASVADKVYLNPVGGIDLLGVASGEMMYKDVLDKVGVKMEVFKVGTFKSAVEPYILNEISEANRLQKQEYIDGLWASIAEGVSKARGIGIDSLNAYVNKGITLAAAEELVGRKLVDSLAYRSDVQAIFARRLAVEEDDLKMITLPDLIAQSTPVDKAGGRVQVVFAEGAITDEEVSLMAPEASTIGSDLVNKLNDLADDEDIKAVVLRVNSPGGSAFISEQIWHAVKSLRAKKPVVVSMGDYAASGGYYIASPANMIVAEPNTLTGSIGIFGLFPNFSELVRKVGVNMEVVKTHEYADMNVSLQYKPLTDNQRTLIQRQVERGYDIFLGRVAEGRKMSKAQVDSVGQGRVWLGKKAISLGLVDKLGGLEVAISEAARLAKLSNYAVHYENRSTNILDELLSSKNITNDFTARVRAAFLSDEERKAIQMMQGVVRHSGIQARLPYDFVAY